MTTLKTLARGLGTALLCGICIAATSSSPARPELGRFGFDTAGMNDSVRPGDDFWEYANGGWASRTTIPSDRPVISQVSKLGDRASSQVRSILEQIAGRKTGLVGDQGRVADYWRSIEDRQVIEAAGAWPLLDELRPAIAATTKSQLAREMGQLARRAGRTPFLGRVPRYNPAPFLVRIEQDVRHPDRYLPELSQSGLSMPTREYYLKDDADAQRIQEAYRKHLAEMLTLAGVPAADAPQRAAAVYAFEHAVALAHWPLADASNVEKTYNLMSPEALARQAPGFDWQSFLAAVGLDGRSQILVDQPSAFTGIAKAFEQTPLPVLKDWLTVRLAKDRAAVLPQAFSTAEFAFSGRILQGSPDAPQRWLQSVELTCVALGDAVSKEYARRYFPPATKAALQQLVANVRTAMDRRLSQIDWMQPETREKARAKLAALKVSIGYPDHWRQYDGLEIRPGDAYGNFVRAGAFEYRRRLGRIDQPADRNEWFLFPMTANAAANPRNGLILFAAAYLQPPHFDPHADPAINYGAIGAVIGHEISHHFDDNGSRFDAEGQLRDWWTPADHRGFEQRTKQLVDQYDAYEVLPGLHIRGAQTLSENIADVAGLAIAYDAYKLSLHGKAAPVIGGYTGDQRFFLGRAQIFRALFRDEELRRGVAAGSYAPSHFRALGVRNHPAWYQAFAIKPGDRMYLPPEQRVRIW